MGCLWLYIISYGFGDVSKKNEVKISYLRFQYCQYNWNQVYQKFFYYTLREAFSKELTFYLSNLKLAQSLDLVHLNAYLTYLCNPSYLK